MIVSNVMAFPFGYGFYSQSLQFSLFDTEQLVQHLIGVIAETGRHETRRIKSTIYDDPCSHLRYRTLARICCSVKHAPLKQCLVSNDLVDTVDRPCRYARCAKQGKPVASRFLAQDVGDLGNDVLAKFTAIGIRSHSGQGGCVGLSHGLPKALPEIVVSKA